MSTKAAPSKRSTRAKGPSRGQAKSKIVVRRLPANLPEHIFIESIKGLVSDSALDRPTTWVAGKVSKNPVKGNTFARAYIYFKSEKHAFEFQKAYHGHLFKDRHGNEGRAHVEFAPFQKIPREQRKADTKQGTIEEDPDYIAFLQSLTADPTDAEKEMRISGTEQLLKESAINPKSTPLLEDLRAQKAAAQAAKLAARQARQAGKAGISNSSKAQITILANRNAKDNANKAGAATSVNSSASANKAQAQQSKKAAQATEASNIQEAKPKRERKRRDRASKRAGNEAASAGNSNQQQGDAATPQITLLKPKNAQAGSQPSNTPAQGSGQQEARPQNAQGQSNQGGGGGSNQGGRRGQQNQGNNAQQPGNSGSGANTKKDAAAPAANPEGGQARSGRSRRNRGAKHDSKAAGDNAAGGNPSTNANNSSGNNNNANSGPNLGIKPEGQSGGGRSRGRRNRGGGGNQENSSAAAAQG
ncbi:hypothetical protein BGX23_008752 [Mortierella sp. AD031]|nr:hypothetical protein BGX23_008752 [Mortierella sp. AD031]KAG0218631.1 hypothetical protein BGX33_006582 [Mortierella sp. NVP41]